MNTKRKSRQMLSDAFIEFVSYLNPIERVLVPAKRQESVQEFFRNRSSTA